MELTRYDRERLGQLTGALSLAGHAMPALWFARVILGLPMEAGGLVLGPLIGFPLLVVGAAMVVAGIALLTGRTPFVAFAALALTVLVDGVFLLNGAWVGWALAGAALSATSLGMFVSLATFSAGSLALFGSRRGSTPNPGDQAMIMVVAMGGAAGLALLLASLAT